MHISQNMKQLKSLFLVTNFCRQKPGRLLVRGPRKLGCKERSAIEILPHIKVTLKLPKRFLVLELCKREPGKVVVGCVEDSAVGVADVLIGGAAGAYAAAASGR